MKQLKKQISESFFNPVLYFLPLIVFIISNNFWGLEFAWKISFPLAMVLLIYIYKNYSRIFLWYIMLGASYLIIGLLYSVAQMYELTATLFYYTDDILFIGLMVIILANEKKVQKLAGTTINKRMPMTNNLDELFRVSRTFLIISALFTALLIALSYQFNSTESPYISVIKYLYAGVFVLLALYEFVRVYLIRRRLLKEDWVPIVSQDGEVIGSEQYFSKFFGEKKYMHPVVRMHIIENGKLLLQKYDAENPHAPLMWDVAVNNHVRVGQTIDQSLHQTTKSMYGGEPKNIVFLSNYSKESKYEFEYIFLFVGCDATEMQLPNTLMTQTKWWTAQQINEELNSGIFTEEFIQEYRLLERSGLINPKKCACECDLKNAILESKKHARHTEFNSQYN